MDNSPLEHPAPWTDEEYLALGGTTSRVDLIEGALWCGPRGHGVHQHVAARLVTALDPAARHAGLATFHYVNVGLAPGSIVGPDLVVTGPGWDTDVIPAAAVALVGEITSPGSALMDTTLRRGLYARAGIPWYLLVELDLPACEAVTLRFLRLGSERYVRHATAKPGETLTVGEPFAISLSTAGLLGR